MPATSWGTLDGMSGGHERLSATDTSFLTLEDDGDHMHVGAVSVFDAPSPAIDGAAQLAHLRHQLASVSARLPRLHQRIARVPGFGNPVWVDAQNFDIADHVKAARRPASGDEAALCELASRIYSVRLDRSRPLWEMWLVPGLAGGRFATVFKVHHCLLDGRGGVNLMQALVAADEHPSGPAPVRTVAPAELFRSELKHRLEGGKRLVSRAMALRTATGAGSPRRLLHGVREALETGLSPTSNTPLTPRRISSDRIFATLRTPLALVKQIKQALGGTLNDVVLALVTGALRSYLREHGTDPGQIEHFRALVPANLRRGTAGDALGNRLTLVMAELPIAVSDPRRRLEALRTQTAYLKRRSGQIEGTRLLGEVDDALGLGLSLRAFKLSTRLRGFNTVISNVPGPPFALTLFGATMREAYPLVPLFRRQGFGVAVFSYAGTLCWGLHADRQVVPDLGPMQRALQAEVDTFANLASS